MRIATRLSIAALLGTLLGLSTDGQAAGLSVAIPMSCDHGDENQKEKLIVVVPPTAAPAGTFKVRIDGIDSGKISHTGLNYIFNMTYEWGVPPGTSLVPGSAKVVPNTGTANVRAGAKVVVAGNVLKLVLPARVDDGSRYTPPSLEFDLKVEAAAGTTITQKFRSYNVTANAIVIGDVHTVCTPKPKPYPVAPTKIEKPAEPAPAPTPAQ